MATLTATAMAEIAADKRVRMLNTGETLTNLIVVALAWAQEDRSVSRDEVYAASTLSRSTVDAHLRSLEQRGLLTRTPLDVFTHL
jgi:DNA-binding MarR family transcriptional regulator